MDYSELVDAYDRLEKTTKRLDKTEIIAQLLSRTPEKLFDEVIYLLQGRVFPKWDERKLGMSSRLMIKAINSSTGVPPEKIERDWVKKGDLGIVVEELIKTKKQATLFSTKLTVEKVFDNIRKIAELEGSGTVYKKVQLVTELLTSADVNEAKFISRTITEDLRIGVQDGVIRDAIVWAFFPRITKINSIEGGGKKIDSLEQLEKINFSKVDLITVDDEKFAREIYNEFIKRVEEAYNLTNDFSEVAKAAKKMKLDSLAMNINKPINPMLAVKVGDIEEAFKAVGRPAQAEYKLDGFRLQIHKDGENVSLFTRRLENVTRQFEEIIPRIRDNVKIKKCILDAELVGYNPDTNKYLPFQFISQRIKRKYHIEKTAKNVPVEINIFDILNLDSKPLINLSQKERRDILEKKVKEKKHEIVLVKKLVSSDAKEIEQFYKESLERGNEGIMIKNYDGLYIPGRRVGGWVKLKPVKESLDLVVTGAEWGEGKRANWLSSFTLSCRDKNNFLEIGKVGTGIKEKEDELSFIELTKILKPKIKERRGKEVLIKPFLVLEISYEEMQKSSNYSSGYALRFPRVVRIRNDLSIEDVDSLDRIKKFYQQQIK